MGYTSLLEVKGLRKFGCNPLRGEGLLLFTALLGSQVGATFGEVEGKCFGSHCSQSTVGWEMSSVWRLERL